MPEYIEIHLIVAHVQSALGLVVSAIDPLGAEFSTENGKSYFDNLLIDLRSSLPFTIHAILQRGKEIAILASNCVWMIKFGQGNYMYYLNRYSDLEKEPFKSDGYLALKGININKEGVLVLMDCRNFRHQIEITKYNLNLKPYEPIHAKWNTNRGSCVLNSNGKIKDIILQVMKDDPTYFSKHSIAHVLFDDKYFNGLGTYTVSEILARIPKRYPYKPWTLANIAFADINYLETLISSIPIFALEVVKYYSTEFNPVILTKKQLKQRNEFRYHCIQVYRRLKVNKRRRDVYFFQFKQGGTTKKIFIDGRHINKTIAPNIGESFKEAPSCEKWIRRMQSKLHNKTIGTGPQEWQLLSMQENLEKNGLNPEEQSSFAYKETILAESSKFSRQQAIQSKSEKHKRKRKRSGNRGKMIKRRRFTSGETYDIFSEKTNENNSKQEVNNTSNIILENAILDITNISNNISQTFSASDTSDDDNSVINISSTITTSSDNNSNQNQYQQITDINKDDFEDEHDFLINVIDLLLATAYQHKQFK